MIFFLADVVVHDPGGDVKQVLKYYKIILDTMLDKNVCCLGY